MIKSTLLVTVKASALASALALSGTPASVPAHAATAAPSTNRALSGGDASANLFQWTFDSVSNECTQWLGPKGYGYVQVSPPQESIQGSEWWTSYQPVSYKIAGKLGGRAQFQAMTAACHAAGVKVVVDAVINNMAALDSGAGTAGSPFTHYDYPGLYAPADFHYCGTPSDAIQNWDDRSQLQNCQLNNTADLKTESEHVRQTIAGYMDDLLSLGADGFRIDGAVHIPAADLANIKARLASPDAYTIQAMRSDGGGPVKPEEYFATGNVEDSRYAEGLKLAFGQGGLASLRTYGTGLTRSDKAKVFVADQDTERAGNTLNYKDGASYALADVFMLAWSYGSPQVYSSYQFPDTSTNQGAPNGGSGDCSANSGWNCEQRWPQVAPMVALHNAAAGTAVTHWWDNGGNAIAFGRGTVAYVAINHGTAALSRTFQTSLPAGTYCDVQSLRPITVDGTGSFTATVKADTALALYAGAPSCSPR